jgi:hypothetical protein
VSGWTATTLERTAGEYTLYVRGPDYGRDDWYWCVTNYERLWIDGNARTGDEAMSEADAALARMLGPSLAFSAASKAGAA